MPLMKACSTAGILSTTLFSAVLIANAGQEAKRAGQPEKPPFTSPAQYYSGVSGRGGPVVGDGSGGWRSGREGVRYKGPNPKPGWHLDWDEKKTATGAAIVAGLFPNIKPLMALHLRDTIIRRGGDGLYYM